MKEMTKQNKSVIFDYFPSTPEMYILNFLVTNEGFAYSKTEVAREVGISPITCTKIWNELIKQNKITRVKQIGRAELYTLNTQNSEVKILMELFNHIVITKMRQSSEVEKNRIVARA